MKSYRERHEIACSALEVAKQRASEIFDIPSKTIIFKKRIKDGTLRAGFKDYESGDNFRMIPLVELTKRGINIDELPEYSEFSERLYELEQKVKDHFRQAREKCKSSVYGAKINYLNSFYMERREIYDEYMSSDEWQSKRKQCFSEHGYICVDCKINDATDIHHRHYDTLGDECPKNDIVPLCKYCHELRHAKNSLMNKPEENL